ncbi:MAG: hypothetical protein ACWGHH_06695 [Sulfurovaceae bacterium]
MRNKLKEKLQKLGYANNTIKEVLSGNKPLGAQGRINMTKYGISLDAWNDIKLYIQQNNNKSANDKSNPKKETEV